MDPISPTSGRTGQNRNASFGGLRRTRCGLVQEGYGRLAGRKFAGGVKNKI